MKPKRETRRTYAIIAILLVAVGALVAYAVQLNSAGPVPPAMTVVAGRVSSFYSNANSPSNLSIILFQNIRTHVNYGAAITSANTTAQTSCPCVYSVSVYSNEQYNVTIQVATTHYGVQNCLAIPQFVTPAGQRLTRDFQCNVNYQYP